MKLNTLLPIELIFISMKSYVLCSHFTHIRLLPIKLIGTENLQGLENLGAYRASIQNVYSKKKTSRSF